MQSSMQNGQLHCYEFARNPRFAVRNAVNQPIAMTARHGRGGVDWSTAARVPLFRTEAELHSRLATLRRVYYTHYAYL